MEPMNVDEFVAQAKHYTHPYNQECSCGSWECVKIAIAIIERQREALEKIANEECEGNPFNGCYDKDCGECTRDAARTALGDSWERIAREAREGKGENDLIAAIDRLGGE